MLIVVFKNKYIKGLKDLHEFKEGDYYKGKATSVKMALNTTYNTDAHFVPYFLACNGAPVAFTRVNKSFRNPEYQVYVTGRVFDLDTYGHQPATEDWYKGSIDKLPKGSIYYKTKNGLRFIEPYDKPVLWAYHEYTMKQRIEELHDSGIKVDRLYEYTRMFRLPNVNRED